MRSWFVSRNGAVALGVIALLTLMARVTFLDALYVPEFRDMLPEKQPAGIALVAVIYMVFVGGWIWALLAVSRGSRTGLVVSLGLSLFVALGGGLFTLLALCPEGCDAWPVGNLIVWANLLAGLVASLASGLQLTRQGRSSARSTMRETMS